MKTFSLIVIVLFMGATVGKDRLNAALVDYQLMSGGETYDSANPLQIQLGDQIEIEVWAKVTDNSYDGDALGLAGYSMDIESSSENLLATPDPDFPADWQVNFEKDWSTELRGELLSNRQYIQDNSYAWNSAMDPTDTSYAAGEWDKFAVGVFDAESLGLTDISIYQVTNTTVFEPENGGYGAVAVNSEKIFTGDSLTLEVAPEPGAAALLLLGVVCLLGKRFC